MQKTSLLNTIFVLYRKSLQKDSKITPNISYMSASYLGTSRIADVACERDRSGAPGCELFFIFFCSSHFYSKFLKIINECLQICVLQMFAFGLNQLLPAFSRVLIFCIKIERNRFFHIVIP